MGKNGALVFYLLISNWDCTTSQRVSTNMDEGRHFALQTVIKLLQIASCLLLTAYTNLPMLCEITIIDQLLHTI